VKTGVPSGVGDVGAAAEDRGKGINPPRIRAGALKQRISKEHCPGLI